MAAVKKMPERLRDDWGRHVVENFDQRPPNLRDLSDWLEMRREAAEAVSEDFDDENKTKHRHVGQRFRRPASTPPWLNLSKDSQSLTGRPFEHSLVACVLFVTRITDLHTARCSVNCQSKNALTL
ncbi:hypothetical protein M514_25645 [Trichuris suis]|uniref:Uncharacterized protein n=1 Tax=Trichuris suis TaxID=68888 RepID=A0A085MY64_9BILA|nr:hypothetical protein M514_25645 [Trichuris suis]